MDLPSSLSRDISPPCASRRKACSDPPEVRPWYDVQTDPTLAAVEAGKAKIKDHLAYFKHHLAKATRSTPPDVPSLSLDEFASLYKGNQNEHGHHFVIHQHNHPKAGVHYDLRLQFSPTSTLSWAFPKGLPGNPNSKQLGRMAIETRVHNLWNNLIESVSMKTGSLLIWDTGTYSVLPDKDKKNISSPQTTDDDSNSDQEEARRPRNSKQESEELIEAFKSRHVRLRLHGTRLPKNYTITLRLPSNNNVHQKPPVRRRRSRPIVKDRRSNHDSDSDDTSASAGDTPRSTSAEVEVDNLDTDSEEDALTRSNNAYPGSANTIGSAHQRRWFVLLDRQSSGFELKGGKWTRYTMPNGELGGFESFVVRGRDYERSIVTGRLARDVENDEGCNGYIGRGGWKGIED